MFKRIALVALACAALPASAHALGEKAWLAVNGGGATYSMKQLNDEIDAYNTANPSAAQLAHVNHGASAGVTIGFELPSRWSFGVGLDRLYADTKASDTSGGIEYNLNANCWRGVAEYGFRAIGTSGMHVGFGLGIVSESGKEVVTSSGSSPLEGKMGGTGALYEGYGGGTWWATPQLALEGTAGYRYAKINKVDIEGGTLVSSNGEPVGFDFSGPYLRVGVKLMAKGIE
jgi:hypothetical protein